MKLLVLPIIKIYSEASSVLKLYYHLRNKEVNQTGVKTQQKTWV